MTPREQAAFVARIKTARRMAMAAAVTIEVRDDAREVRQQAAVAALQGLAAGLQVAFLDPLAEPSAAEAFREMPDRLQQHSWLADGSFIDAA